MSNIATIISVAEATHYIVGITNDDNQLIPLPKALDVTTCDSLVQAKQILREHQFEKAQLILQSAYDEMCGSTDIGGNTMQIDLNWY